MDNSIEARRDAAQFSQYFVDKCRLLQDHDALCSNEILSSGGALAPLCRGKVSRFGFISSCVNLRRPPQSCARRTAVLLHNLSSIVSGPTSSYVQSSLHTLQYMQRSDLLKRFRKGRKAKCRPSKGYTAAVMVH